jgi:DNA-binding GntR family transcriptional regulator
MLRTAIRAHEKLLAAIEAGNEARAAAVLAEHLTSAGRSTLASGNRVTIQANLVGALDLPTVHQAAR